jgi:16S rRNA processing protein RimM
LKTDRFIPDPYIEIGLIIKGWGLEGHMKVKVSGSSMDRFDALESVTLVKSGAVLGSFSVTSIRYLGNAVLLKLADFDNVEAVKPYIGSYVCVDVSQAVKLDEWEYFHHDLVGLTVEDTQGEIIGILDRIWDIGPHDVYCVQKKDGVEVLIPAIRSIVKQIDLTRKKIVVDCPEGMLSL